MDEPDGVSGADGGIAQGLGQEALADASRSHQQHMLVLVEKLQEKTASSSLRSRVMDADQPKSSRRQVSSKPALWRRSSMRRFSRRLISSARMISRNEA